MHRACKWCFTIFITTQYPLNAAERSLMEGQHFQVDNSTNRPPIFLPDSSYLACNAANFPRREQALVGRFLHATRRAAQQPDDVTIASMLKSIKSKIGDMHPLCNSLPSFFLYPTSLARVQSTTAVSDERPNLQASRRLPVVELQLTLA
jgi:hypothetical protein